MKFEEAAKILNDNMLWQGNVLMALYSIYREGQKHLTPYDNMRLEEHLREISNIFDLEVEDDG